MGRGLYQTLMACGCKNKQKQTTVRAKAPAESRVPLGMADDVPLPMRLEKIYMGYDVVIQEHSAAQTHPNAINIPGRNAMVSEALRNAIISRFPSMFKSLDQLDKSEVVQVTK